MLRPPFMHSDEPKPPALPDAEQAEPSSAPTQDWIAFDWKSVASLRAPDKVEGKADRAWDSTEWDDPLNPVSHDARSVAEQLNSVAQKIRNGDLSVSGKAQTPETAMVAALEALIRAK